MSDLLSLADAESLDLWNRLSLAYTESAGHSLLRRAIADQYQGMSAAQTLVVVPEEGIFLAMHALLRPGDHVVCSFPGYQSLYEVARSIGCEVTLWKPKEKDGWRFDPDDLETLLRPETRLVVVNFPHNPTGSLAAEDEFGRVVELARERSAYLFSDEMYRRLEHDGYATLPAACDVYDRAISLSGLSKAYGLPGLRVGWLAARDERALQRIAELKDYTTICHSAPSEILALMALRACDRILAAQRARVHRNLALLERFFGEHAERFEWQRPGGGSIAFPRMLGGEDTGVFCRRLVDEDGIMLLPSEAFGYGSHHVRIGYGREDLPAVLDRFAAALQRLRG